MDQLYKKIAALRDEFTEETGTRVINSQGEPDVDYVDWLEKRIVTPDSKAVIMPTEEMVKAEAKRTNNWASCVYIDGFIKCAKWFRSQVSGGGPTP